jgi:hypothetical protein
MSFLQATYRLFVIGMISLVGYLVFFAESSNKGLPSTAASIPKTQFYEPPQALPAHGSGHKYFSYGAAPLEVKTPFGDYHHVLKVVEWNTKSPVVEVFARSGQTINLDLPLGSYELRYASGKIWYGWQYLFGPETTYSKADSIFTFSDNGYQASGYTVELIMQPNGNLHTSGLPPAQW